MEKLDHLELQDHQDLVERWDHLDKQAKEAQAVCQVLLDQLGQQDR